MSAERRQPFRSSHLGRSVSMLPVVTAESERIVAMGHETDDRFAASPREWWLQPVAPARSEANTKSSDLLGTTPLLRPKLPDVASLGELERRVSDHRKSHRIKRSNGGLRKGLPDPYQNTLRTVCKRPKRRSGRRKPVDKAKNGVSQSCDVKRSGWGGIRTHGTRKRTPVFKTGAFVHSATHPFISFFCKRRHPARHPLQLRCGGIYQS